MNTPLIEAMVRGMCRDDGWCRSLNPCATCSGCDSTFFDQAKSALTAITEAGYAVVPVEPTPGMAKIGVFVAGTGAVIPAYEAMVRAYSSMISAAQGDG